jgi:hypothetical protein
MLDFNVGEVAQRVRNLLTIKGRMPLGLDESIVATVLAADSTLPPWRRTPYRIYGTLSVNNTTVGEYASAELHTFNLNVGATVVVDRVQIIGASFITASGVKLVNAGAAMRFLPAKTTSQGTNSMYNFERYPAPSALIADFTTDWAIRVYTGNATDPMAQQGLICTTEGPTAGDLAYFPCEIPLSSAQALRFEATNPASAANTSRVIVNVSGLYYPVQPL